MVGPDIPANPRYQILCVKNARIFAASAIAANMGRRVLTNMPSYCAKNPMPIPLANDPSAGKHEAQPMAAVSAPTVPVLSNKRVIKVKGRFTMSFDFILKLMEDKGAI